MPRPTQKFVRSQCVCTAWDHEADCAWNILDTQKAREAMDRRYAIESCWAQREKVDAERRRQRGEGQ